MIHRAAYRLYLKLMARGMHSEPLSAESENWRPSAQEDDFLKADAVANSLGDAYRGAGVVVGLLGITVVFIAVAPTALHIGNEHLLIGLGVTKVVLMTLILFHVYFFGFRSGHHRDWIRQRQLAEELRYQRIKLLKEDLMTKEGSPQAAEAAQKLVREIKQTISGPDGQIAYNRRKAALYTAVEHFGHRINWFGFIFALLCAIVLLLSEFHLVPHMAWLIFGTAAVPALVAGIHGINGLLKIESLCDEHRKMSNLLDGLNKRLNAVSPQDTKAVREISDQIYSALVDRDVQWTETIQKIKITPA